MRNRQGTSVSHTDAAQRHDREGQRLLSGYVDEETHRAVKMLAAKEGTTNLALIHEAVSLLLVRHNEPVPPVTLERLKEHKRPLPPLTVARKSNGHRPG